jgi:hypothetical protein
MPQTLIDSVKSTKVSLFLIFIKNPFEISEMLSLNLRQNLFTYLLKSYLAQNENFTTEEYLDCGLLLFRWGSRSERGSEGFSLVFRSSPLRISARAPTILRFALTCGDIFYIIKTAAEDWCCFAQREPQKVTRIYLSLLTLNIPSLIVCQYHAWSFPLFKADTKSGLLSSEIQA